MLLPHHLAVISTGLNRNEATIQLRNLHRIRVRNTRKWDRKPLRFAT